MKKRGSLMMTLAIVSYFFSGCFKTKNTSENTIKGNSDSDVPSLEDYKNNSNISDEMFTAIKKYTSDKYFCNKIGWEAAGVPQDCPTSKEHSEHLRQFMGIVKNDEKLRFKGIVYRGILVNEDTLTLMKQKRD